MKVLLVGNYGPDRQESMLRFAAMLRETLPVEGVDVGFVRPEPVFGRFRAGPSGIGKWLGYLDKFLLFPRRLRAAAEGWDLVHLCDHSNAPVARALPSRSVLVTCHDLLAVRSAHGEFPQNRVRWSGRVLQRMILSGLKRAGTVVADSRATMRDAARLLGREEKEIPVVHPGVNPIYRPTPGGAGGVGRGYLLHVGGSQWYKNREGLIRIYAEVRNRMESAAPDLVVVGPKFETMVPGVRFEERVSDEGLRDLYAGARLLVFPSFAEGYGWPVLEAMACGCPVAATGRAPMTELGGDVAAYFDDPDAHADAADVVVGILEEVPDARARRVAAGLAWVGGFGVAEMAWRYAALYREVLAGVAERGGNR
jgi:glycosyltransferase involved in cell wall biosynthesis